MKIDIPLSSIILGELLFVLLVITAFLVLHLMRQKDVIIKLKEKLASIAQGDLDGGFYGANKTSSGHSVIIEYFEKSLADSLQRFHKFTGTTQQPDLKKEYPFSGKIAALRHIYLSAEQELITERGITHAGWGMLERRLANIVQLCDQSPAGGEAIIKDLQLKLRTSANEIKRHQAKNVHLLKRLENLRNEQHGLERLNTRNSVVIEQLQNALHKLKNSDVANSENTQPLLSIPLNDDYIEKFGHLHSAENHNMRALLQEIKNTPSTFNPAEKKRVENQINMLEIELFKSDRHINDLKQQLKNAKLQMTNYALISKDKTFAGDIDSLYKNLMQKVSPTNQDDPDTIIAEIKNLQNSNTVQHSTISNLENEISTLKDSMNSDDTDDINKEKEKEIHRLERLVTECQGCIIILEEEVDNLYARLQEQSLQLPVATSSPLPETAERASHFEEVELLLDELQKTATNYQHVYAINSTLLEFLHCREFDDLANQLLKFVNTFNLPAAFIIHCDAGEMEYLPAHLVNDEYRDQLMSSGTQEQLIHLTDATLFVYPNIRAATFSNYENDVPKILDTNFQMIIAAVNERLDDLSQHSNDATAEHGEISNIVLVKDMLINLNIRNAFQVDENRKTFDHFLAELRLAYSQLELKGTGAIVLENAVNEFEMRMSQLLEGGETIDKEISLLVEKMENP